MMSELNTRRIFAVVGNAGIPVSRNLETWNQIRREYWAAVRDRVQNPQNYVNGLHCPECGWELYDTMQVTSTGMTVKCTYCKFKGERAE